MADVRPFRGIRYNSARAGDLSLNVCPPFDVISPSDQQDLYQRSPYNAVRLEFGRELPSDRVDDNRYIRAAAILAEWLESGVLAHDDAPAMYLLEEAFSHRGRRLTRRGILAAVRLEEFGGGTVLPHEYTRPAPKRDRLELMRATRANFSPLMTLFRDTGVFRQLFDRVSSAPPLMTAEPPGMPSLKLWTVSNQDMLGEISGLLSSSSLYLADGHHRYETAISFRDEIQESDGAGPDDAVNFRMMSLIPIDDPGLLLLGYHRTVGGCSGTELEGLKACLRSEFDLESVAASGGDVAADLEDRLRSVPPGMTVFGIAGLEPGAVYMVTMRRPPSRGDDLHSTDYARLHDEVLRSSLSSEREAQVVSFDHDAAAALRSVESGDQQMAFIMRPVPLDAFERIVSRGDRLPSKSTFFHPKLHTGSVIQSLEGPL